MTDFIEQLEKVEIGMAREEAVRFLPRPKRIRRNSSYDEALHTSVKEEAWSYTSSSADATVYFRNDKVARTSSEVVFSDTDQSNTSGRNQCGCK